MAISSSKSQIGLFFKLACNFDLANALFRSFELTAIKVVLQHIEVRGPALDIGCAEGYIARELFSNKEIIGFDYDIKYLLAAKNLKFYKHLIAADARKFPFKDNSLSFLFSNSVIEHIKELDGVLAEAKRVLSPGGVFLLTVPNNNFSTSLFFYRFLRVLGLKRMALLYAKERNKRLNHFHLYSLEEWSTIMQKAGLKVELMVTYLSASIITLWDLIAAEQFALRKIFSLSFNMVLVRNVLSFIYYIVKIIIVVSLLPFCILFGDSKGNGCATLLLIIK